MKKDITKKQKLVLKALKSFIAKKGYSPTLRELMSLLKKRGLRLSSLNSLVQYLKVLEEKYYIQRFSKVRGIRLLNSKIGSFIEIPLVGSADCGEPLCFADNYIEDYINISKKFIRGAKENYFFVKAVGDSMDKDGINDSDYVLIKRIQKPEDRDNVLAVVNGLGTIKRFRKEKGMVSLLPNSTNPRHQPIFLHPDDKVFICGKVEKVFKLSAKEKSNK